MMSRSPLESEITPKSQTSPTNLTGRSLATFLVMVWSILAIWSSAEAMPTNVDWMPVTLTNISQVQLAATNHEVANYSIRLKGTVLWVNPGQDRLILQDDSGGAIVKIKLQSVPAVQAGDWVSVQGNAQVSHGGEISDVLVDNDGVHASLEKSGTTFLSAGLHPITVEWFNNYKDFELKVDWMGPGISRGTIPEANLMRGEPDPISHRNHLVRGLDYHGYEGDWLRLPDFSLLSVVKSGVTTNLTLAVRTRDTCVGVVFSGYLKTARDGDYTFWSKSDDGSRLFIGEPLHLTQLGRNEMPSPHKLVPSQFDSRSLELQWVEVAGTVTRVRKVYHEVDIEVSFGAEHIYLKVATGDYDTLRKLLHGQIKATGIYQNAYGLDGQIVPSVLVRSPENIIITQMDSARWLDYPRIPIRSLVESNSMVQAEALVRTGGVITSNCQAGFLMLEDSGGRILMEKNELFQKAGDEVEVLGWLSHERGNPCLRGEFARNLSTIAGDASGGVRVLTKAMQVKSLSREEARRGYPVTIKGVVTAKVDDDFVIQDSTWSIFCYGDKLNLEDPPKVGEVWEVEGASDVGFAPDIVVQQAKFLGPGILPEPIHPTRDELINGSLDTQYIEIQGIVSAVRTNAVRMLTREGEFQFSGLEQLGLDQLKDALIRIRGICIPDRDTNQMLLSALSPIRFVNASANVDEPAPTDPFAIPLKHISDLLLFDARADALRRVGISGQILHESRGEYLMTDGRNGARFELREPIQLESGDLVQVVGFPDVNGSSPVLHEAQVRVRAKARLPEPRPLSEAGISNSKLDATLISTECRLLSLNKSRSETSLELQTGSRSYTARLAGKDGGLPNYLPGSLLKLTGVYVSLGGNANLGNNNPFELLLMSPSDVLVLQRPSWWTVRHALVVIGGLLVLILGSMIWITLLRRQVEERTCQLASEIKGREQAEYQRALEAERTRIAQDLHDELGATLTEIRFLGAVKSRDPSASEDMRLHLKEVSDKSHQMVSSLDEIVWAVNPANDYLPNLASYLCHVAEEFFRASEIRCRLDMDEVLPALSLSSEMRHSLYLVVREALNNIAKHSQAKETWLRIHYQGKALRIVIEDNGRGFEVATAGSARNGLSNMRSRLKKIGGDLQYDSKPGRGTICRIELPLT
jgi:signal transduction histidine kinase